MLLDRRKPVDAPVVGEGFIVVGDQTPCFGFAEIPEDRQPHMSVKQHPGAGRPRPRHDKGLDDADLGYGPRYPSIFG